MIELKRIIIAFCLTFFMVSIGEVNAYEYSMSSYTNTEIVHDISNTKCAEIDESNLLVDCTIRIKNDDGVQLEITFHDVSVFQCAKIKIGKFFKDIF